MKKIYTITVAACALFTAGNASAAVNDMVGGNCLAKYEKCGADCYADRNKHFADACYQGCGDTYLACKKLELHTKLLQRLDDEIPEEGIGIAPEDGQ